MAISNLHLTHQNSSNGCSTNKCNSSKCHTVTDILHRFIRTKLLQIRNFNLDFFSFNINNSNQITAIFLQPSLTSTKHLLPLPKNDLQSRYYPTPVRTPTPPTIATTKEADSTVQAINAVDFKINEAEDTIIAVKIGHSEAAAEAVSSIQGRSRVTSISKENHSRIQEALGKA